MTIELIRLKVTHRSAPLHQLLGGVLINGDGTADFFHDTCDHAEIIAGLLDDVDIQSPMTRVTPADLAPPDADGDRTPWGGAPDDSMRGDCVRIDAVRIGDNRIIGPLLLRRGMPLAVGGAIDATTAAIIVREIRAFRAGRDRPALRRAA